MPKYNQWKLTKYGRDALTKTGGKSENTTDFKVSHISVGNSTNLRYDYFMSDGIESEKNIFYLQDDELVDDIFETNDEKRGKIHKFTFNITNLPNTDGTPRILEEYFITEIGLMVKDTSDESLHMLAYTTVDDNDNYRGEFMYPYDTTNDIADDDSSYNILFNVYLSVSNEVRIGVYYDFSKVYLTRKKGDELYPSKQVTEGKLDDHEDRITSVEEDLNNDPGENNSPFGVKRRIADLESDLNDPTGVNDEPFGVKPRIKTLESDVKTNTNTLIDHAGKIDENAGNIKNNTGEINRLKEDNTYRLDAEKYGKEVYTDTFDTMDHLSSDNMHYILRVFKTIAKKMNNMISKDEIALLSSDTYDILMGYNNDKYNFGERILVIKHPTVTESSAPTKTINSLDELYNGVTPTLGEAYDGYKNLRSDEQYTVTYTFYDNQDNILEGAGTSFIINRQLDDIFSLIVKDVYNYINKYNSDYTVNSTEPFLSKLKKIVISLGEISDRYSSESSSTPEVNKNRLLEDRLPVYIRDNANTLVALQGVNYYTNIEKGDTTLIASYMSARIGRYDNSRYNDGTILTTIKEAKNEDKLMMMSLFTSYPFMVSMVKQTYDNDLDFGDVDKARFKKLLATTIYRYLKKYVFTRGYSHFKYDAIGYYVDQLDPLIEEVTHNVRAEEGEEAHTDKYYRLNMGNPSKWIITTTSGIDATKVDNPAYWHNIFDSYIKRLNPRDPNRTIDTLINGKIARGIYSSDEKYEKYDAEEYDDMWLDIYNLSIVKSVHKE